MSQVGREKPQVNTTSGSFYFELYRRQGKKDALDGAAMKPSDTVYYDPLGFLTLSAGSEDDNRTVVDLTYPLSENKAQQVGDPNVW